MNQNQKNLTPFGLLIESNGLDESVLSLNISALRNLVQKEHLIVLRGFQLEPRLDSFATYCRAWGEIAKWPFGEVLDLREQKDPEDHIFDHNYVPLHWDGMYRPEVPEFQIFQCVTAPKEAKGGRTLFVNTKLLIERTTPDILKDWTRVIGTYERKMEFYHSKTVAPLIDKHPFQDFPVLRYCEPTDAADKAFINHPEITFTGISNQSITGLRDSLRRLLYDPNVLYAHSWQDGDILIADNFTLLHGREAFEPGSPRHLRRVHIQSQPALKNPHLVFHI
jgi:alpha-ketoglutarate-dependent taurine dioxygenase